jgi:hypothetical protein
MTSGVSLFLWVGGAGAAGGALNAVWSHNLFLWPARPATHARLRLMRPGLVLQLAIGAAAALAAALAFLGPACPRLPADLSLTVFGGFLIGALAARWPSNEADKQVLRAAVIEACAAPAAHPDTTRAIELVPPYEVFVIATQLAPGQYRGSWTK